jgi:hypothetical protein
MLTHHQVFDALKNEKTRNRRLTAGVWSNAVRLFFALWYLLGSLLHVAYRLNDNHIYAKFGRISLFPFFREMWTASVMPHILLFALLLAAFEEDPAFSPFVGLQATGGSRFARTAASHLPAYDPSVAIAMGCNSGGSSSSHARRRIGCEPNSPCDPRNHDSGNATGRLAVAGANGVRQGRVLWIRPD